MKATGKIEIRPELLRFAEAMERVLRENDWKGSTEWGGDPHSMLESMWDEIRELDREAWGHPNISTGRRKRSRMKKEAVDVANFAMLYWLGLGHPDEEEEKDDPQGLGQEKADA